MVDFTHPPTLVKGACALISAILAFVGFIVYSSDFASGPIYGLSLKERQDIPFPNFAICDGDEPLPTVPDAVTCIHSCGKNPDHRKWNHQACLLTNLTSTQGKTNEGRNCYWFNTTKDQRIVSGPHEPVHINCNVIGAKKKGHYYFLWFSVEQKLTHRLLGGYEDMFVGGEIRLYLKNWNFDHYMRYEKAYSNFLQMDSHNTSAHISLRMADHITRTYVHSASTFNFGFFAWIAMLGGVLAFFGGLWYAVSLAADKFLGGGESNNYETL